jgi:hypothetical protein
MILVKLIPESSNLGTKHHPCHWQSLRSWALQAKLQNPTSSFALDEWIILDQLGFAYPSSDQLFYLSTMSLPMLDGSWAVLYNSAALFWVIVSSQFARRCKRATLYECP